MIKVININGPINSGKTTVSKLLVQQLLSSVFIEVDELLSDEEKASLKLDFKGSIIERLSRLEIEIKKNLLLKKYDYIIFAYPMNNKNYNRWQNMVANNQLICITLAPSLENCLINRGTRELDEWEINRIKEMYQQGFHQPNDADLIINNDKQTPQETVLTILEFIK